MSAASTEPVNGWQKHKKGERVYYHNKGTGETLWEEAYMQRFGQGVVEDPSKWPTTWYKSKDGNDRVYYWNAQSKRTLWEPAWKVHAGKYSWVVAERKSHKENDGGTSNAGDGVATANSTNASAENANSSLTTCEEEAKRKEAETEAEAEAKRNQAEAEAEAEAKRKEAEAKRMEAEAKRKEAEAEAEAKRKEAEAEAKRKESETEAKQKADELLARKSQVHTSQRVVPFDIMQHKLQQFMNSCLSKSRSDVQSYILPDAFVTAVDRAIMAETFLRSTPATRLADYREVCVFPVSVFEPLY